MREKTHYVLVGVFVVALGLALVGIVLWLGGGGPGRDYEEYVVYMQESVSGLSRDNVVKYHGVDVGRVHEIGLDPERSERVRLLLQIEKGTPVREDTVATLETQGLTGLAYINLKGEDPDSPLLEARPGQSHPEIKSRPSAWGHLDLAVEELVSNLNDVTKRFKVLLSEENQLHLSRTLAQLDTVSATLAGRAGAMGRSLDELVATLEKTREAGAGLPGLVAQLGQAAEALERMAEQVGASGETVGRVVEARDRDLSRFTGETLPEAAVMIGEMRRAASSLRRFSEQLERDPGVLLRGAPPRPPGPGE
jgi:phospholipid/cholesterol/gamma-HCH transport system substrate-binding protein